jgi:hypothetical protein
MLREVFKSVPVPLEIFHFRGTHDLEKIYWLSGLHVGRRPAGEKDGDVTPESATSIYLWAMLQKGFIGGHEAYYRFDGKTGKLIRRIGAGDVASLGLIVAGSGWVTSRGGTPYAIHFYSDVIYKVTLGPVASPLVGEEVIPDTSQFVGWAPYWWTVIPETTHETLGPTGGYPISRFEPYIDSSGRPAKLNSYGTFALDDQKDVFINCYLTEMTVWSWSTGKFKYAIGLPDLAVSITFEDDARCYIFLNSRTVMLFDYLRAEVMGIGIIPPTISGKNYWNNLDVVFTWDAIYRRLLVAEFPFGGDVEGVSTEVRIRGYRFVEEPGRLTTPIPLRVPRKGRTIPVLVKVVNEKNAGIGGYAIDCTVTGEGSLVGVPITDHYGNAFAQVKCEGEAEMTSITVRASVKIPIAIPPISGVPGAPPPGGGAAPGPPVAGTPPPPSGGTNPPPPEGGSGTTLPPAQAPNMVGILTEVYNAGAPNGKPWDLSDGNKYNANGNGVFVESGVTAMHDRDARFGHLRKTGGTQYNGHAIDATVYKRTDGVLESIDFITGDPNPSLPGGGHLTWQYNYKYTDTSLWYYPA